MDVDVTPLRMNTNDDEDELNALLDEIETPRETPSRRADGSRPTTGAGGRAGAEEDWMHAAAEVASGSGLMDEGSMAQRLATMRQESMARAGVGSRPMTSSAAAAAPVRLLEPDPDTNHRFEEVDGEVKACVKDTLAIRASFLHYCNSRMRPIDMQRMAEHGMTGPFLTPPYFMAMCRDMKLLEPHGPLSFSVVGAVFSGFKDEEVQGLAYAPYLEALVELAFESERNVAAQIEEVFAARLAAQAAAQAKLEAETKLQEGNLFVGSVDALEAGLQETAAEAMRKRLTMRVGRLSEPSSSGPIDNNASRFTRIPLLRTPSQNRMLPNGPNGTPQQPRPPTQPRLPHRLSAGFDPTLQPPLPPQSRAGPSGRPDSSQNHGQTQGLGLRRASVTEGPAGGLQTPNGRSPTGGQTHAPVPPKLPRPTLTSKSAASGLLPSISIARRMRSSGSESGAPSPALAPRGSSTGAAPAALVSTTSMAGSDDLESPSTPQHPLHQAVLLPQWSMVRQSDPGHKLAPPPGGGLLLPPSIVARSSGSATSASVPAPASILATLQTRRSRDAPLPQAHSGEQRPFTPGSHF